MSILFLFELIFIFIFGLALGSFLNVVIFRLRSDEQWTRGRSHCVSCKTSLTVADLVPLASFVILKGKCRYCATSLSWQYPVVELVSGILCALAYLALLSSYGLPSLMVSLQSGMVFPLLLLVRNIFFICILLVIFVTDLRWYAIYDGVVLLGAAVALAFNVMMPPFFSPQYILPAWMNLLAATALPVAFFGLQYAVSSGRWIGSGDILLGALMGLMLGFPQVIAALFIAYCLGALYGIALYATGKNIRGVEVQFGTFLTGATMLMIIFGDKIMVVVSKTFLI